VTSPHVWRTPAQSWSVPDRLLFLDEVVGDPDVAAVIWEGEDGHPVGEFRTVTEAEQWLVRERGVRLDALELVVDPADLACE
jgi:hypothetical protein